MVSRFFSQILQVVLWNKKNQKGDNKMFGKKEFLGAIVVSFIGGLVVGYNKARERCLQAIIIATAETKEEIKEEEV